MDSQTKKLKAAPAPSSSAEAPAEAAKAEALELENASLKAALKEAQARIAELTDAQQPATRVEMPADVLSHIAAFVPTEVYTISRTAESSDGYPPVFSSVLSTHKTHREAVVSLRGEVREWMDCSASVHKEFFRFAWAVAAGLLEKSELRTYKHKYNRDKVVAVHGFTLSADAEDSFDADYERYMAAEEGADVFRLADHRGDMFDVTEDSWPFTYDHFDVDSVCYFWLSTEDGSYERNNYSIRRSRVKN